MNTEDLQAQFKETNLPFSVIQVEEYRQVFDQMDKDRNGSIDIDELREVIERLELHIS